MPVCRCQLLNVDVCTRAYQLTMLMAASGHAYHVVSFHSEYVSHKHAFTGQAIRTCTMATEALHVATCRYPCIFRWALLLLLLLLLLLVIVHHGCIMYSHSSNGCELTVVGAGSTNHRHWPSCSMWYATCRCMLAETSGHVHARFANAWGDRYGLLRACCARGATWGKWYKWYKLPLPGARVLGVMGFHLA